MKEYTREDIWNAVENHVLNMTVEDLRQIVADDLYEFYRQAADYQELEAFIERGEV